MFNFAWGTTQQDELQRKAKVESSRTIVDWLSFCSEICMERFIRYPQIIGGEGMIVEFEKAVLARRKYNRRRPIRKWWILCGICLNPREAFAYHVPDGTYRTAGTV